MFTPNQCQDNAQAVGQGQNMDASRRVRMAMSAYNHSAVGATSAGTLRLR